MNDQVRPTAATVTVAMQSFLLDVQAGFNVSTSSRMRQNLAIVDAWADSVTDPRNPLYSELDIFSATLLGGLQSQASPLASCANAVFSNWQTKAAQKSPVDDRQYFNLIINWVLSLLNLQAQAMQMIQAANQYKAANLYIQAAEGDPNAIARTLSPDFCYYAVRAPSNNPLSAAAINCKLNDQQTAFIYNNL